MLVEPFYLVTKRVSADLPQTVRAELLTNIRKNASRYAIKLSEDGLSTVVYECKIVEVHHASKKARSERKVRKRKALTRISQDLNRLFDI